MDITSVMCTMAHMHTSRVVGECGGEGVHCCMIVKYILWLLLWMTVVRYTCRYVHGIMRKRICSDLYDCAQQTTYRKRTVGGDLLDSELQWKASIMSAYALSQRLQYSSLHSSSHVTTLAICLYTKP